MGDVPGCLIPGEVWQSAGEICEAIGGAMGGAIDPSVGCGVPVPEAAGFLAMLAGAKEEHSGDDALLNAASALLDHLYAAFTAEDD